ncbi:MAG: hypothetical protein E6489_17730, partial [Enterococcus avium]|nr:hypothetical protein [Enterococcus avium]
RTLNLLNRRIRVRTYGGVRGAEGQLAFPSTRLYSTGIKHLTFSSRSIAGQHREHKDLFNMKGLNPYCLNTGTYNCQNNFTV